MEGARLGPYQLLAELGSGGMGKVYRAEVAGPVPGLDPGCAVALKVIHPHLLETPGFFKRFLREADIGRTIEHENVVRTYDCDALLHDGIQQNFLVMEYVEGQTLRDLLKELERVPEELCRHIGREVAKGLACIHDAGVVHRDLKPENVLITEDHVVKVMDLGVARLQDEAVRLSQTGAFVGSLEYAAPEQFRSGGSEVDARSDLHALGVMLYELSTGQHPYRTDDVSSTLRNVIEGKPRRAGEVNPQLSPFFEEVIHTLAASEPGDRFPTALALLTVLEDDEASAWWKERAHTLRVQTKRPLRRIRIPRETSLYGRDEDLAKLHGLYEKAKAGDGQVLLIEGEAGIGKTRLVDEFVGRLREEGEDVNFVFGSYPPGGAATAAGAFAEAYREQFGAEGLADTLKGYLTATPVLIPAFAALLRGETTPAGAEPLTKDALQTVFAHATRALAAERPTVVLIDDLHFAPEDGRALFSSLALAIPRHRILLVGTMRPGVPEAWTANVTRLEHAEQRAVSRLGPKDLSRLLKDAFRSERLARELAFQIGEKSDGNPFFAFEIIQGLREGQFISRQADGTWATTRVIEDIQVPSSVLDLVNARVADLSEEERDLLDVASAFGFRFDGSLVGAALGMARIPALRRFATIEKRHRLVRSAGEHFVFDHHQVQEALYGALPPPLAREYHAAIADAMEASADAADEDPAALPGALCVDLTGHFLKGGRGTQACRYLDAALDHLEKAYLNEQAVALADRALSVPGLLEGTARAKVLLRKNARLHRLGRRKAQEAVLAEARSLIEAAGERALLVQVEKAASIHLLTLGRYEESLERSERAMAVATETGMREEQAGVTLGVGVACFYLGRFEEARSHYERSLVIARELGDTLREGDALGNLGSVSFALGRYAESQRYHEEHLAIAREAGDRRSEELARGNLGYVHFILGRHDEAREHHERTLAIAREIGDRGAESTTRSHLGNALFSLGRYDAARQHYEESLTISREIGDPRQEALAQVGLGNVSFVLGQGGRAQECFEQCLAIARETGDVRGEALACGSLGTILPVLGRSREGRVHVERCLAIARETGDPLGEAQALGELGAIAELEGDASAARSRREQALTAYRTIGHPSGIAETLVALGRLHEARGDTESSRKCLEEALALGAQLDASSLLVLASCHLAALPGGDAAEALTAYREHEPRVEHVHAMACRFLLWKATNDASHLAAAKGLLDEFVGHAPQARRESLQKNVPLNREIMEAWAEQGGGE